MQSAKSFFNESEQRLLIKAIEQAELKTSGEIRVHVENFCFGNELKAAGKIFTKLGMRKTAERNGILIYIAVVSRKVAIYGDEGIHKKLENDFWSKLVSDTIQQFKANHKAEGLAKCIVECGEQLGKYFPRSQNDNNELTNSISFK